MLPSDSPPETGILTFEVPIAPVSFQATSKKKAPILSEIRAAVSPCRFLLGGDVKLSIEWRISERARYEADSAADVDNIVKPIMDALSGPDGVLVDDCQVQELMCYWTGGYSYPEQEQIAIELRFDPDAYLAKSGLVFLHLERGLYYPIHDNVPAKTAIMLAEHVISRFDVARKLVSHGIGANPARLTLPIQRVFHRSRIRGFRTTTLGQLQQLGDPRP